jgi:hypothetical protein
MTDKTPFNNSVPTMVRQVQGLPMTPIERAARAIADEWQGGDNGCFCSDWPYFIPYARSVLMAVNGEAVAKAAAADWVADHGSEESAVAASDMDAAVRYIDEAMGEG